MSLLTGIISPHAFEIIRDRIGEILADEIANQYTLTSDEDLNLGEVWIERFVPFDKEELPTINVSLASGAFSGQTQKHTDGVYTYFIDVYTKAKTSETDRGDVLATIRLHRLLGVCRAILENPQYKTLLFTAPFIFNRHFESLSIAEPGTQDAVSSIQGRLTFSVKAIETNELITPILLGIHDTRVKLNLTDKGYFYSVYG